MAAGGQIHYTEDSKRWADLLAAFISAILDTEHPYLLPPVGWYQLEDGRWLYTPQMKDTLATSLLDTTDLEKLPLALVRILGIIKTRISDKFEGVHRFFALLDNDVSTSTRMTVDDIPKHFNQMLDQHGPDVLLSVYGDNPGIAATIGDYRSMTNFSTLLTRTMTEPWFPLCLIVSTNGITNLQRKYCLFLPREEDHTAALPLSRTLSGDLCALIERNPDTFERIVERTYTATLDSLDEECAFRHEIGLLSISSAVLCWALKHINQPDLANTAHDGCQTYINNCLSEWENTMDCNAKKVIHEVLYSAQEAGNIRFLRYGEVDASYDSDRDIVQKKDELLLSGTLLKSLIHEYAPGYSASDIISRLQSDHLLSVSSYSMKIHIIDRPYANARLMRLKCSCMAEDLD